MLIDRFTKRIIFLSRSQLGLILKKIINFLKSLKRRIDILSAETQLKFILEK